MPKGKRDEGVAKCIACHCVVGIGEAHKTVEGDWACNKCWEDARDMRSESLTKDEQIGRMEAEF